MGKDVVRTEAAPAPFQGAPYSQAIVAGGFVFVVRPGGSRAGRHRSSMGGTIGEQTEQVFANLRRDPRGGRSGPRPARQDDRLPRGPRTVRRHERGLLRSMSETSRLRGPRSKSRRCRPARSSRSRPSHWPDAAQRHNLGAMRAETVIATHANTDFDALASMLAVRHLYPGAVVCLSGALNRNVRELCRLYAEELELVEASRLELDSVRRLIVVEAASASRLAELEPLALDSNVEKVVFDHHAGEAPDWTRPENVVLSEDGALTTTLVGILAEREVAVSPLEATIFALGIHEDTGSLTYPSTRQRDADALSWCLRHGARQELLESYLHTPLAPDERELLDALIDALEPHDARRLERARGVAQLAELRGGSLEPRAQDRRPHRLSRPRAARGDGAARLLRRSQPFAGVRRCRRSRRPRRRRSRAGRVGHLPRAAGRCARGATGRAARGGPGAAART